MLISSITRTVGVIKWGKILYEYQPFLDNYVPSAFLPPSESTVTPSSGHFSVKLKFSSFSFR
jgi:hypothetical protein